MKEREEQHPKIFAFVDVETTGMRPLSDRIIEIAVLRVEQGVVVETFTTLIHPGATVPRHSAALSGITTEMLLHAPSFEDVALKLESLLHNAVLVAHNAHFDYGFIKNEFRRIGMKCDAPLLCTVKLSRALYRHERQHDLDSLMNRHQIVCTPRHRALPDAHGIYTWFNLMYKVHLKEKMNDLVSQLLIADTLPPLLHRKVLATLPDTPGIYFFYGQDNALLYVGKSKNIRTRVRSHFSSSERVSLTRQGKRLYQETARVEVRETPGELSALLLEARTIKTHMPLYNRALRRTHKLVMAQKKYTNGYASIELVSTDEDVIRKDTLALFRSLAQAKTSLRVLAKEHMLCTALLGVEKTVPCFGSHIGTCKGACSKREDIESYNHRFDTVFSKRAIRTWPYKGAITIEEKSTADSGAVLVVENWQLKKWLFYSHGDREEMAIDSYFEYDTYKILARYILNASNKYSIKVLSEQEYHRFDAEERTISYT